MTGFLSQLYKIDVLFLQINCVLTEFILEMHGIILFFSFKSACSVGVRKVHSVPVTLGQFRVLVPVVRCSVVTSGNTESSVSCNSGKEVICVDLKADKTFVQKYSQPHLQQLIDKKSDPLVEVLTSVGFTLNAGCIIVLLQNCTFVREK